MKQSVECESGSENWGFGSQADLTQSSFFFVWFMSFSRIL
jgi:hypothetical protein